MQSKVQVTSHAASRRAKLASRGLPLRMVPRDDSSVDLEDIRLIRRMAARDAGALGEFYDRWVRRVYAAAMAILRVEQDAEEVVEDTFWQAWTQAERFDASRGQPSAWIMTIARSRALDRLKSVKRRREDELPVTATERLVADADQLTGMIEADRKASLSAALEELPAGQRVALEMAYFGGLSQTEIATATGEAIGTVKTRMRLGMQKLRERFLIAREEVS